MRLSIAGLGILLAIMVTGVLLTALVRIVPNETLGVRVRFGVATGTILARGVHLKVPWFYDIRIIKPHIHISEMGLSDGRRVSLSWRVADALRFYPLVADVPESLETLAGETAIQPFLAAAKLDPVPQAETLADLRQALNAELVSRAGLQILRVQIVDTSQ